MNCSEVISLLRANDNFLLVTHKNPDGDTLGSSSALCSALRRAGKTAHLFPNPQVTDKFASHVKKFFAPEGYQADFVVSVDVPAEDMFCKTYPGTAIDLCIDHHPTNPGFGKTNLIVPEKAACGEIVLELCETLNGDLSREEANLLYIAVSTDTGCFQYSNTNAETFLAAAKLLNCGAENSPLNLKFFRKVSRARIELEGLIYKDMTYHHDGKVVFATLTREMISQTGAKEDDLDDIANLPGRCDSGIVSTMIREMEDGCKISMRSLPIFDCSAVCAVFGGGGHKLASGCFIRDNPEGAKKQILAVIGEVLG